MKVNFIKGNKYLIVANFLNSKKGNVLDIGSRDRILLRYLDNASYYQSADLEGTHDYAINIEKKTSFSNQKFSYTVALDVLEHVSNIHDAFDEVLRITSNTFIMALPNCASFHHRFNYLFKGKLATNKYNLLPYDQGDRHRWLTVYPDIMGFVEGKLKNSDFIIEEVISEYEGSSLSRPLVMLAHKLKIVSDSFSSRRLIFFITRKVTA
jgi:hypothetical protein